MPKLKLINLGKLTSGAQRWDRTTDTRIFSSLLENINPMRMHVSEITVQSAVQNY